MELDPVRLKNLAFHDYQNDLNSPFSYRPRKGAQRFGPGEFETWGFSNGNLATLKWVAPQAELSPIFGGPVSPLKQTFGEINAGGGK